MAPTHTHPTRQLVRVTAAIIENDGNILIAQRHRNDRMAGLWEFPGGKIEAGETPQQCLLRELREELEMEAIIGPFLGSSVHHYDHISIELIAYRAYWNGAPFSLLAHQACRWVPPSRLIDFCFTAADLHFVRRLVSGEIQVR